MFPIELHDYREGMQVLAYCHSSFQGVSKFELPGSVEATGEGGFQVGVFYPLSVKEIRDRTLELGLPSEEITQGTITTGKIELNEDLGYMVSFSSGQEGFLPYSEEPVSEKQLRYIPVRVVQREDRIIKLERFSFSGDCDFEGTISPGAKIRGIISEFTNAEAEVKCNSLPHFTAKLAFQHFRRHQEDSTTGFYNGFEDDFFIIGVDFQLNELMLSCSFEYHPRNLFPYLQHGRYILNQKVFLHEVRTYLRIDLSAHDSTATDADLEGFANTWLYVNDTQLKNCDKLEFPPVQDQVIPMLEVEEYQIFEDAFRCIALNTDKVEDPEMLLKEQEQLIEKLPFKVGERIPKIYEVIVNDIRGERLFASTSYILNGNREYVKASARLELFGNVNPKENLNGQYKLTTVAINFSQTGKAERLEVSPFEYPSDTLNANKCSSGDFGSGIVVRCMNHEPYSIIEIFGEEAMCFERLELKRAYSFEVVFKTAGFPMVLYETDEKLSDMDLLSLYKRESHLLLLERFELVQQIASGSIVAASDLVIDSISPGCLICDLNGEKLLLPVEILKESEVEVVLEGKKYNERPIIKQVLPYEDYVVIKQFGDVRQNRTLIVPTSHSISQIILKEEYEAVITRVSEGFYIALLFNGSEVHIRLQDAGEKCYLLEVVLVQISKQLEHDFYIGRICKEQIDFEDTFVPHTKPEFARLEVAPTESINGIKSASEITRGMRVLGDLLMFEKDLPYPQLVVDLGSGLLGRLDLRGLLSSDSFDVNSIEALFASGDYESVFKELVRRHSEKEEGLFSFYARECIDFIGEQMTHLSLGDINGKGLSVVDLDIFSEPCEKMVCLVIFVSGGITMCQLLQRKRPALLILTEADLAANEKAYNVGEIIDFAEDSLVELGQHAVSKLLLNGLPAELLLWDYEYYALHRNGITVEDEIQDMPYVHERALLPACELVDRSNLHVRISPAAYEPDALNALETLSPYDVAWCRHFVPSGTYELHKGMVVRSVVLKEEGQIYKLSLGLTGRSKLSVDPDSPLEPQQILDVVVEQANEREVIVSRDLSLLMPRHDVGTVARSFSGVMVRREGNNVICQLDSVYPSTQCLLIGRDFVHGESVQLTVEKEGDKLVATALQREKTEFLLRFGEITLPKLCYPSYFVIYSDLQQLNQDLSRNKAEFNLVLEKASFLESEQLLDVLNAFPFAKLTGEDLINYFNAELQVLIKCNLLNNDFFSLARQHLKNDFLELIGQYIMTTKDFEAARSYVEADPYTQSSLLLNQIIYNAIDVSVEEMRVCSEVIPFFVHAMLYRERFLSAIELLQASAEDMQLADLRRCLQLISEYADDKDVVSQFFKHLLTLNFGRHHKKFTRAIEEAHEQFQKRL